MRTDLFDSCSYLLARLARIHRNRVGAALQKVGLHVGQEMVLLQLWMQDGQTQSELVERTQVEPPTVTKMLTRMEAARLVERRRDPQDARVSRVYLTEQGRALEDSVSAAVLGTDEQMLRGFTLEERLLLRRMLMQMLGNLAE